MVSIQNRTPLRSARWIDHWPGSHCGPSWRRGARRTSQPQTIKDQTRGWAQAAEFGRQFIELVQSVSQKNDHLAALARRTDRGSVLKSSADGVRRRQCGRRGGGTRRVVPVFPEPWRHKPRTSFYNKDKGRPGSVRGAQREENEKRGYRLKWGMRRDGAAARRLRASGRSSRAKSRERTQDHCPIQPESRERTQARSTNPRQNARTKPNLRGLRKLCRSGRLRRSFRHWDRSPDSVYGTWRARDDNHAFRIRKKGPPGRFQEKPRQAGCNHSVFI